MYLQKGDTKNVTFLKLGYVYVKTWFKHNTEKQQTSAGCHTSSPRRLK